MLLPTILLRASLRYALRHPWQIGLCVLGVALGVAVVVSIDLANASASRALTLSTETIAGRATHQVSGGTAGLDEAVYRRLRVGLGLRQSAPVVTGYATAPAMQGITLQLLGVDPLAEQPFRAYTASRQLDQSAGETGGDLTPLLVEPATVLMLEATARRYGLAAGDTLTLQLAGQQQRVRIVGLLQARDETSRRALENLLIADIATAQEVLGMVGKLSRIDLILPEREQAEELYTAIEALLPPGAELTRPAARSDTLQQMTRAFRLNLSALSLLALIVGMFLIYNTMTFTIVQRREMLGTLRCLGTTRRQLVLLVLLEALLIGLVGSLLGLLLGVLLGRGLVQLVTRTINDLYFVVQVRDLALDPLVLLKGLILGLAATLAAAAVPAWEAMRVAPRSMQRRSSLEERMRQMLPWATLAGVLLLVAGVLLIILSGSGQGGPQVSPAIISAFVALFLIVIGCALLTPGATVLLMALLRPLLGRLFGLTGRMAARDVVAALSRTSVAIAALMVAISVTIGVGTMVGSFRQTVITWLEQSLIADIYVSTPGGTSGRAAATLPPGTAAEFARLPGVVDVVSLRRREVDTASGPTTLIAVGRAAASQGERLPLRFKQAVAQPAAALEAGAVLLSEPLAFRLGLGVGDTLLLQTDQGARTFPIAGVYYDYSSDRGVIRMDDATYRRFWDDDALSSLGLFVAPGVDIDALVRVLREQAGSQELIINANRELRAHALEVFDRTFAITTVLQMLATLVAFIGVLSALMALQLERGHEVALLRATGFTPRQVWRLVLSQTGLMGLVAGVLALPVGLGLALVLIFVINRRSFGWTLEIALDPLLFAQAVLVALLAALLAGIYPALRMVRINPALALREE